MKEGEKGETGVEGRGMETFPVVGQLETGFDGLPLLVPRELASIRRHRGQALRWLVLKGPAPHAVTLAFYTGLKVRRAFVRAGMVEKVVDMLGRIVEKMERGEWELEKLCTTARKRMAFGPFVGVEHDSDLHTPGVRGQMGLAEDDNTVLAEFFGSSLLIFATALSRLHPLNSIEGHAAAKGGVRGSWNLAADRDLPSRA